MAVTVVSSVTVVTAMTVVPSVTVVTSVTAETVVTAVAIVTAVTCVTVETDCSTASLYEQALYVEATNNSLFHTTTDCTKKTKLIYTY